MLDFRNINAFGEDKAKSFESLIRLLAIGERPDDGVDYQANDGRGGDGGVEALWITSDGKNVGYQAKYFWSFDSAQLRQMDDSVTQAIAAHPQLKKYIFAIPFDPTANRGPKVHGKSEWKKWEERVMEWKALAAEKGIDLEFELWTATIITKKILRDENSGLHQHWFVEEVLDDNWFCSQVSMATRRLNDRFNPEDHVDVDIEDLFDAVVRGSSTLEKIASAFTRLGDAEVPNMEFEDPKNNPDSDVLAEAQAAWHNLLTIAGSFTQDLSSKWIVDEAIERLSALEKATYALEHKYLVVESETLTEADQRQHYDVNQSLRKLTSACYNLKEILNSHYLAAENSRCCLVYGPAGAGKSHLLARVAEERVNLGFSTVLLLGQDYSNSSFWHQTGNLLQLQGRTSKEILGALNAVGLRKSQRVLILFDAINEGEGSGYWRLQIPGLIEELKNYSHVKIVFSCREEYLRYAVPENILENLPRYYISGFSTPEELENAAIRYLDHKGIARPNTPWLSAEFSNPLFLKTASEALFAKHESEFSVGLNGISEIMALYLDALCWRVETASKNAEDISNQLKAAAQKIAGEMATKGSDFLYKADAALLVDECFSLRDPPAGKTWLQVLTEVSLFRFDAPPFPEEFDPMNPPPERVRFAFQRFQDHLMAVALTKQVLKGHETNAFASDGPLSFLLVEGHSGKELDYRFAGLVGALSTIFPEKLGIEFATTLPEWKRIWKDGRVVQTAFAESFKWRRRDAFFKQTNDLLNKLDQYYVDLFGLLMEVSMTAEHHYNALSLHEHLKQWRLPERDSMWTRWVNQASRSGYPQVGRIVSWALSLPNVPADTKHLKLASIVLAWSLSSSHMTLRDRATKALTTLFLEDPSVFEFVGRRTHDCNDPYVIERLYAAAYGACCLDPDSDRLSSYSGLIYEWVFADGEPPVGLLARDYALGVIELAKVKNALSDEVCLPKCYHPFSSTAPIFDLERSDIEGLAEKSGGKRIFWSASGDMGDYGRYSIPGKVQSFLTTPLNSEKPLTASAQKEQFLETIINPYPKRVEALKDLEDCLQKQMPTFVNIHGLEGLNEDVEKIAKQHSKELNLARKNLEKLLTPEEQERLSTDYLREGRAHENIVRIDVDQCKLWVTKRAYELGWTADRFPGDGEGSDPSRSHNDLERIGKKYQRIALDELQARLADNFWMLQGWTEEPTIYRYSDHDFRRNIDPTILPTESKYGEPGEDELHWVTQPEVTLPHVDEKDLEQWPFQEDPTASFKSNIYRTNKTKNKWLVLYEFSLDEQKHSDPSPAEHGFRYQEFRYIYCVLLQQGKSTAFAKYLKQKGDLSVRSYSPIEYTDGPYLLEAPWRDTWQGKKFLDQVWGAPLDLEFAIPVADYYWESHLDKTLPNGFSRFLPQKWFADELGLQIGNTSANSWVNSSNNTVFISISKSNGRAAVVIDEEIFMGYSKKYELEPVWIMIAERNAWPKGGSDSSWRRSEAVAWRDGETWKHFSWHNDN